MQAQKLSADKCNFTFILSAIIYQYLQRRNTKMEHVEYFEIFFSHADMPIWMKYVEYLLHIYIQK